jgi:alpha-L-fucosidase
MKIFVSSHSAYNFTGYYQWVPSQSDASLKIIRPVEDTAEQLWYDKLKEVIDKYQPDIMWHDFNLGTINEAQRLNYLSYYYNKAVDWGKEVVVTSKDGFQSGEVYDYERRPAAIRTPIG